MSPSSELDRLFAQVFRQIPVPDGLSPLAVDNVPADYALVCTNSGGKVWRHISTMNPIGLCEREREWNNNKNRALSNIAMAMNINPESPDVSGEGEKE